ncbi:PepSY domain-containing protein [Brevibacillus migulae]|uniref:PepSY domain-containing protein n=1 Tax=Brevibacillus migulae TaxID=1644114 RepID=UPI00106EDC51|nr:PepSY domain-containing protein [Brevibacillus migulae]
MSWSRLGGIVIKRKYVLYSLVILLVGLMAGMQTMVLGKEEKVIEMEKVKEMIESRYAGEVTSIALEQLEGQVVYRGHLKAKPGTYQITVDAYEGRVQHIEPIALALPEQSADEAEAESETDGQNEHAAPRMETSAGISLDRAREIAMTEVEGRFDGIEVEQENGVMVFEVEIDTAAEQEVKVQVDAYTGAIVSVVWED